ncbi:MAG: hypothetical protein J6A21_06850 [Lentisphaeria bacterium]|nr:hypothetical protein [Lentisphaeria bacterium]
MSAVRNTNSRKKLTFALFVSNRTTFAQEIVEEAIAEVSAALKKNGIGCLKAFPVADEKEGLLYAEFLEKNRGKFDGVVAVFPNFGDEGSTFTALRDARVPILFQAYPDELDRMSMRFRRDAFCGKISAVNLFRQTGIPCTVFPPHTVAPSSAAFDRNLKDFSAVCRIVKGMKRVRCGSIGARCTPFKTVRFDETALEQYGISNEAFDLSEVFRRVRELKSTDKTVKELCEQFRSYAAWPRGSEEALKRTAGFTKVILDMIDDYGLDLITLRCWTEIEQEFRFSPCAVLSFLNNKGIAANCEVDTVNALAMRMLSLAADAPSACLDWNNNFGDNENACILFHCGPTAGCLMQKKGRIVDHPMFARVMGKGNGFGCNEGRMKPGVFTCAGGYTRQGKLSFFLDNGRFLEEQLPADFFGCGGIAEFDHLQEKMVSLLRYGFPHHVSLSYGDHYEVVREAVESYLRYDLVRLGAEKR